MTDDARTPPPDYPTSLLEFQRRFQTEEACAAYLVKLRWPEGFVCPACEGREGWELKSRPFLFECAARGRQTSVRAGTILHDSRLPLTVWFWAAWLVASHSNGISAKQLQRQLGLGSYKSAWLLLAKLRRAMVDPERDPLAGLVEADEASMAHRRKDDPVSGGGGRSTLGRMAIAGAVEITGGVTGRLRLGPIADYSAKTIGAFLGAVVAPGALLRTDGWSAYPAVAGYAHEPHVIGPMAAHVVLEAIHQAFSNLRAWAIGVYHGLRPRHLQSYLDEFVFRFNRRKNRPAGFRSLLRIGTKTEPVTYRDIVDA